MESNIQELRINNLIDYHGNLGYYDFSRVVEIESDDKFYLTNKNRNDVFVGYDDGELKPILLTKEILEKLGFEYSEDGTYSIKSLKIKSYGYPEGKDVSNMTYVDLGLRIIPSIFPDKPTVGEVNSTTISV